MISDSVFISVSEIMIGMTVIIMALYPVLYIVRSMVEFVSKAFSHIDIKKVWNVSQVDIGRKLKK